jgi:hypothetical protein
MYSYGHGVKWSLRGVSRGSFLNFSKFFIFGRLAAIFGSKLTPKFTKNHGAFCFGWAQAGC